MSHPNAKTIREVLPREFFVEHTNSRAVRLLDREVIADSPGSWPGTHRNVHAWWILAGPEGYAVGWNENPGRGWSFPVCVIPSHR